jgi:hypothetical protein
MMNRCAVTFAALLVSTGAVLAQGGSSSSPGGSAGSPSTSPTGPTAPGSPGAAAPNSGLTQPGVPGGLANPSGPGLPPTPDQQGTVGQAPGTNPANPQDLQGRSNLQDLNRPRGSNPQDLTNPNTTPRIMQEERR